MKGDFSRFTFDPHKHYEKVYVQQGRVQLDADWNEQADILLHLIRSQIADIVGASAAPSTAPGFFIKPMEAGTVELSGVQANPLERPADGPRSLPDFLIGPGFYYVDGIRCENDEMVLFSRQRDFPAAMSQLPQRVIDAHDQYIIYLDVWQRLITALEDPGIREPALGGADTTARVQTVWQVKLLPLSGKLVGNQRASGFDLRALPEWSAFLRQADGKGCLQAMYAPPKGENAHLENHLYRVEIHAVTEDLVTYKWSRENGSVALPVIGLDFDPARAQQESEPAPGRRWRGYRPSPAADR